MSLRNIRITDDIRKEICGKFDEGKSIPVISSEFKPINSKTITSILRLYKTTGRVEKNYQGSTRRPKYLNDTEKTFIILR